MRLTILSLIVFFNVNTNLIANNQTLKTIKIKLKKTHKTTQIELSKDVGKLCEFIAKTVVAQKYNPNDYEIKTNIAYQDRFKRRLGELDIVVFSRRSKNAVMVIEVKCRKNREKAWRHANEQLLRFKETLNQESSETTNVVIAKNDTTFKAEQFKGAKTQVMMPKQCATCKRGSHEFDLTLKDIESLQASLSRSLHERP